MRRVFGGAIALLMVGLAPATAQNTGIYIGVNGGYQMGSTEADLNAPAPFGSLLNIDGLASKGMTGGMQGGFDYRFPSSPFVLGVFAEWNPLGSADFSITSPAAGLNVLSSTIEDDMKGGLRIGYVAGNALLYVGGFVSKADLKWTLLNGALTCSEDMKGKGVVAGIQVPLAANISAGLQYSYTQYDTVSYTLGGGPLKLDLDTEVQAVTGRINFHFHALETKAAPLK